ncbi:hypothetical protein [Thalassotalea sp. ND16A]|uniref:hypothetical protein n=1 Tax=Thalassotalea sp. ND16A TaxID=1535422 RepID=UPI00051DEBF6|nr:hypothetical protein [Thalassotalea sp. ND16A]KGJ89209.1 hypothetical protein ND16A_2102 [Thalassotalea sp. ND16A]
MKTTTLAFISTVLLAQAGCAFVQEDPCEKITFSAEQQAECASLQRQIVNAKGQPIKRTELERRYELDCVNLRYYRDDMTDERCENKASVDKWLSDEKAEIARNPEHGLETKDVVEPKESSQESGADSAVSVESQE